MLDHTVLLFMALAVTIFLGLDCFQNIIMPTLMRELVFELDVRGKGANEDDDG